MIRMLRQANVDVVHSHEFTMAVYGTVASSRLGIPHVITMHGNQEMTAVWRRRVALRWAFRRSKVVTAVSQVTARQLEHDLGLVDGMIEVIRNGVPRIDGNARNVRKELGLVEDELIVFAVGNLDPRKGHMVLLRALQGLRSEGSQPWRVVIAGGRGGPEREPLEAFAAEHGFSDQLCILSQRDDIPDLLAAADIFVMPSLWEGLPLALLEAMLAGKAIVASATSGIPEAITTGEHGLLVPPNDVDALRLSLEQVLRDRDLRDTLGANARARGLENFTVEAMANGYERLY